MVALFGASGAPTSCRRDVVVWLPELGALRFGDAVERLAGLPKPMKCVAFVASNMLHIGTWHMPDDSEFNIELSRMARSTFDEDTRHVRPHPENAVLVTTDAGDATEISPKEFEQWLVDYSIALAAISLRAADALGGEATFVARVSPSADGWLKST